MQGAFLPFYSLCREYVKDYKQLIVSKELVGHSLWHKNNTSISYWHFGASQLQHARTSDNVVELVQVVRSLCVLGSRRKFDDAGLEMPEP